MDLSQDTRVFLSVQDRWMEQKTEQMPGGSFSVNEHNRLKGQSFQSMLGQATSGSMTAFPNICLCSSLLLRQW